VASSDWSAAESDEAEQRVGSSEAKAHSSRLLSRAEQGETIVITKHGRDIARLVPVVRGSRRPDAVVASFRRTRRGVRRGDAPVWEMLGEGRR
jgi:prevent-host-death family protein